MIVNIHVGCLLVSRIRCCSVPYVTYVLCCDEAVPSGDLGGKRVITQVEL
jgi:hypothetical protein